ncbi:MAG: hypothetical protein ACR2M9_00130 [Cyanophyceae cyanobacterium]
MVPKLMLDGMPYSLSEITPSHLTGDTTWNGVDSAVTLQGILMKLDRENKGPADNGYWISFVEIMDSNGDWFVPAIQYAFHVFQRPDALTSATRTKIYNMFTVKDIYVRNIRGDNEWKLVNRTHDAIPNKDQVAQGVGKGRYGALTSEDSYIWTTVDAIDPSNWTVDGKMGASYVVSEWLDISSFAYRELLLRDIDPDEGELKMLIQVAADTNMFQAAINKDVI